MRFARSCSLKTHKNKEIHVAQYPPNHVELGEKKEGKQQQCEESEQPEEQQKCEECE